MYVWYVYVCMYVCMYVARECRRGYPAAGQRRECRGDRPHAAHRPFQGPQGPHTRPQPHWAVGGRPDPSRAGADGQGGPVHAGRHPQRSKCVTFSYLLCNVFL